MSSGARSAWFYVAGLVAAAVVIGGVVAVATGRQTENRSELSRREQAVNRGPLVAVVTASTAPPERHIELLAEARPYAQVTLYAKVSGYLKTISVDKGDRVRRGQVLARIESPELDRQLDAAVADFKYKKMNAARAASLAKPGVVSARDAELAESSADVARATVSQFQTQRGYQVLRAPFDGTVTARFADPGALMQSAINASTGALPVVTIGNTDRLRVSAYVDQRDAAWIKPGADAEVRLPDRAAAPLLAKVARSAGQVDAKTRTMLIEIDVDNRDGRIVAGSFLTVTVRLKVPPLTQIPAAALVLRDRLPFVAVLDQGGKVHYRPVVVADDDGLSVRLSSGLAIGERVAIDLGDSVVDGAQVQPVSRDAPVKK